MIDLVIIDRQKYCGLHYENVINHINMYSEKYPSVLIKRNNLYEVYYDYYKIFSQFMTVDDKVLICLAIDKIINWKIVEKFVDKKFVEENITQISLNKLQF